MGAIPKIKIEITIVELRHVTDLFAELDFNSQKRNDRVALNVLDLVCIKLLKKLLSKRNETSPFTLSLEYFEAHFLEQFLIMVNNTVKEYYVQTVINKLNQKLA